MAGDLVPPEAVSPPNGFSTGLASEQLMEVHQAMQDKELLAYKSVAVDDA